MAIDFPDSPSINDEYEVEGRSWIWDGSVWNAVGEPGPAGPPNELTVGTVTTGNAGTSAAVTISGEPPSQTVDFTIPRGAAATIAVGTVTTGNAGTDAEITNSGTSGEAVFDFTIPKGDQGIQGIQGEQGIQGIQGEPGNDGLGVPAGGSTGQLLAKVSGTDNDTEWVDGFTTGKAIAMAIVFG